MRKIKIVLLFFIALTISATNQQLFAAVQTGNISGTVFDKESNEPLMGANVSVIGFATGAATNIDGKYVITNLEAGDYTIKCTYLGYEPIESKVTVFANRTLELNFELTIEVIEGAEVTVTAQREGQLAAINQQLQSDAIMNVVSSDKIQELPEATAAEAVGRLPGISLIREGGEGSKIVIRGLEPKYNKIQIDGIDLASTESSERSTDLSMISPFMLSGIEVTKSAMADQEANQLGGTVNFVLKGAPFTKPSYQLIVENGYNGLRDNYSDYKIIGQHNRRLFDDALGLSINVNAERKNTSSNSVSSDYHYLEEEQIAAVNSLSVVDVLRDIRRYGGSFIVDYNSEFTKVKFSSMFSSVDRETVSRGEYSSGFFSGTSNRTQSLTFTQNQTTVLMNKFNIEQFVGPFKIEAGGSFAYSDNDMPEQLNYGGYDPTPLDRPVNKDAEPADIPGYMANNLDNITLDQLNDSESFTKETELGGYFNLFWEDEISQGVNLKIKTGLKFEHKTKYYDYNQIFFPIQYTKAFANQALIKKYEWMQEYYISGDFPYRPFIDEGFDPGDFMAGEFSISRVPKLHLGREMIHYLQQELGINWEGSNEPLKFVPNFHTSKMNDYNGTEDYMGAYLMPTLKLGDKVTIIPGIRYEKNQTEYTGVRGNSNLQEKQGWGFVYHDTTMTRDNEYFLPMLHAKIKPFDGFDIRISYTHTLSRPSYYEIIPAWYIYRQGITYRNPNLKPSKSKNLDIYFSFYGNKIGLLTIGGFKKQIDDLVFYSSKTILSDTVAVEEYGLTEEVTGQNPSKFAYKPLGTFINNPKPVDVYGFEIEWQTNTWFLPGLLKNLVFSINYTYTHSEAVYPKTKPIIEIVESPFGNREKIVGNEDDSYKARLLMQPDHILNVTLGYDYKDFSIRASMQRKSDIFSQTARRPSLRGSTDAFTLYDLSISQKLPVNGLVIYGNLKNITKTIEGDTNAGSGKMSHREYYGMNGGLGLKYTF